MVGTELVELTVEEIAAGGDGLARLDSGRVVFVPRTAPGDRVVARLTDNRARWSRGRVVEWKARGPDRVTAPCPHFEDCGGCAVQHLATQAQVTSLQQGVQEALRRIGGVDLSVESLRAAERRFGYRNRVTFTLRRRRGAVYAGYHGLRGRRLAEILDCPLAEDPIREAWTALRGGWGKSARHLPAGGELRLTLRASASGRCALLVDGGSSPGAPDALLSGAPVIDSYWWQPDRSDRRHLGGDLEFPDVWDGMVVPLRPGAFLQVNREVAVDIDRHLVDGLGPVDGLRVLDLYGGVGLRALAWTRAGADAVLVESDADAVETARDLARREDVDLAARHGRVEDALEDLLPADIVLVNPPRAGLGPTVSERLARGGADRLLYASCDPGTLARDVARLSAAWRPVLAQPFDAFPQTGHVETVVWFERVDP